MGVRRDQSQKVMLHIRIVHPEPERKNVEPMEILKKPFRAAAIRGRQYRFQSPEPKDAIDPIRLFPIPFANVDHPIT